MAGPRRLAPPRGELRATRHQTLRKQMAQRLRELRKKHGLSRDNLAQDSSVSYDQITKLEDASGGGSIETWCDLADALGEPLEALFAVPTSAAVEARSARERPRAYSPRGRAAKPATVTQVTDLSQIAAQLDGDAVAALLVLARRLRRQP